MNGVLTVVSKKYLEIYSWAFYAIYQEKTCIVHESRIVAKKRGTNENEAVVGR